MQIYHCGGFTRFPLTHDTISGDICQLARNALPCSNSTLNVYLSGFINTFAIVEK